MLVLSRKQDERIIINNGMIVVTIIGTRHDGTVILGFEAPREVTIHREEVQERIDQGEKRG